MLRALRSADTATIGLIAWITVELVVATSAPSARASSGQGTEGAWSSGGTAPSARSEVSATALEGSIVVAGGLDAAGRSLDTVTSYDPVSGAWTAIADLPEPRDHGALAAWADRMYFSGGGEFARRTAHPDLWAYDPKLESWASLTPMPHARWQHAMVALDGVLYIVGGIIDGSDDHTAVWAYDLDAETWRTDLAPLPTPREHLAAVAADGRVIVLAGRMGGNLDDVEIYDPHADAWTAGPEMPTPRSGFTAVHLADGVHVTGGEDFGTGRTIEAHERLELESMTWSTLPALPTARHGIGSAVVGGRWYVIAGGTEVGLSTSDLVEVWQPGS